MSNKHCSNQESGFTFLELMFVLAVISILAIFAVPRYEAVKENYRLEGAAQKVVSQLNYGKQMAMDKRETITIVFQEDRVGVYRNDQGTLELTGPALLYQGGVTFSRANNPWLVEVHEDADNPSSILLGWGVRYNFRGFPLENGAIQLHISEGNSIRISIGEQTGTIEIE